MIKGVLALLLLGFTLVRWFYAWFGLRLSYSGLAGYSKQRRKAHARNQQEPRVRTKTRP